MHKVGERYQLGEKWGKYPMGMKVKLMVTISYDNALLSQNHAGVIEVSNGGSEWKYVTPTNFTIIDRCEDLNDSTSITFIPLRLLIPIDNDKIIIWSLANKWNVRETDYYNNWRKETFLKYGYDIHEFLYKNR
jgi:hypothetical protein